MDIKLLEIYNKYYETKTYAIIEKHFKETFDVDVWNTLKEHFDKGYVRISNINTWSHDFLFGGSNKVYLVPSLGTPVTHNTDRERINLYGNIALGDIISLLRTCNELHMEELYIEDIVPLIQILATMMVYKSTGIELLGEKLDREEDVGRPKSKVKGRFIQAVCAKAEWITRVLMAALVSNEITNPTKFIFKIPTYVEYCVQMTGYNTILKGAGLLEHTNSPKSCVFRVISNALMFANKSSLKLREGFTKSYLEYHLPLVTPVEQVIYSSESVDTKSIVKINNYLENHGMEATLKKIEKGTAADRRELEVAKQLPPIPQPLYVDEHVEAAWNMINASRRVKNLTVVDERPALIKYKFLPKFPIATTEVDLDRLSFDNATKDEEWLLNMAVLLYTNAQEINALRASRQTAPIGKHPLRVVIYNDNDELQPKLVSRINEVTESLKSAYMHIYDVEYIRRKDYARPSDNEE